MTHAGLFGAFLGADPAGMTLTPVGQLPQLVGRPVEALKRETLRSDSATHLGILLRIKDCRCGSHGDRDQPTDCTQAKNGRKTTIR